MWVCMYCIVRTRPCSHACFFNRYYATYWLLHVLYFLEDNSAPTEWKNPYTYDAKWEKLVWQILRADEKMAPDCSLRGILREVMEDACDSGIFDFARAEALLSNRVEEISSVTKSLRPRRCRFVLACVIFFSQ